MAASKSPSKNATINDVATLAGVSVGTVSNVINNRANVTAARRQRVQEAIETLSFSVSAIAQGMRGQRFPLIGLCLPSVTPANLISISDFVEEFASQSKYEIIEAVTRHDPHRELMRIERFIASRVSGVILVPTRRQAPVIDVLKDAGMPTVVINRLSPGKSEFDQVLVDHRAMASTATKELLERGLRNFIVATQFPGYPIVTENVAGIRAALEGVKDARVTVLRCGVEKEDYIKALKTRFADRPENAVIVACSSLLAAWTFEAMREIGLRCPDDVSLISIEQPLWALATTPTLSCIEQPTRDVVRAAWDLLMRRIDGDADGRVTIQCEPRLHLRGSVIS